MTILFRRYSCKTVPDSFIRVYGTVFLFLSLIRLLSAFRVSVEFIWYGGSCLLRIVPWKSKKETILFVLRSVYCTFVCMKKKPANQISFSSSREWKKTRNR